MRVTYATTHYGSAEKKAVMKVLENPGRIVAGTHVEEFEKKIAKIFGKRFGVMVNSGSSANLIALSILDLPAGSEVITPALTFSTTVAPIIQRGLKPVFVDVAPGTFCIDVTKIETKITKKTKAMMIPSLIGNLPDFLVLRRIARKHKLFLIEDSCDTLGVKFAGKPTGTFTHITTTSFYASHIVTAAGGGGMLCLNDPDLARRARVMAYWGRQSTLFGAYEKSEELKKRFAGKLHGEPYDAKFIFSEVGYNMQPLELQGAFGLEQLKRLKANMLRRKKNVTALRRFFAQYPQYFELPIVHAKADVVWLAFPFLVHEKCGFTRFKLAKYLEEHDIQTRPIFTGNVLRQPGFERRISGRAEEFPVADSVMHRGLLIGCHHDIDEKQLKYVQRVIEEFLKGVPSP